MIRRIGRPARLAALLLGIASCRPAPAGVVDGALPERGPCSSWTCAGCCAAGECKAGADPALCGSLGGTCVACPAGESCLQGSCVRLTSCGPSTCPQGCCDGAVCLGGEATTACGTGGQACSSCPSPQVCAGHACVAAPGCVGGVVKPLGARGLFGKTCNETAVLASDGAFAGLDRSTASEMTQVGGTTLWMASCVEVDLGQVVNVESIVVRARAVNQACVLPCTACSEGLAFSTFHGVASGTYTALGSRPIATTVADHSLAVAASLRYILVCRATWGEDKVDVAVDYVHATCR